MAVTKPLGSVSAKDVLEILTNKASQKPSLPSQERCQHSQLPMALCRPGRLQQHVRLRGSWRYSPNGIYAALQLIRTDSNGHATSNNELTGTGM